MPLPAKSILLIILFLLGTLSLSSQNAIAQSLATVQSKVIKTENDPAQDGGLSLKGRFHLVKGTNKGFLILHAKIPAGSYIYSVSQPEGGPTATKIKSPSGKSILVKGKFVADAKPLVIENDPIFKMRVEKHIDSVQFFVPIEVNPNQDPKSIRPLMNFEGQICSDAGVCTPIRNRRIAAEFAGYFKQQAQTDNNSQNLKR